MEKYKPPGFVNEISIKKPLAYETLTLLNKVGESYVNVIDFVNKKTELNYLICNQENELRDLNKTRWYIKDAIYVYHKKALLKHINDNSDIYSKEGIPLEIEKFIIYIFSFSLQGESSNALNKAFGDYVVNRKKTINHIYNYR